jgi:site-specific DNA-methyltransferase (adenine-specific)
VVARKPLSGTVAGNVLVWGTGGLNIDGCRVGTDDTRSKTGSSALGIMNDDGWKPKDVIGGSPSGRWPANIVLDGAAAAALDQQSGVTGTTSRKVGKVTGTTFGSNTPMPDDLNGVLSYGDKGGASRYFTQADFGPDDWPFVYQAKPSKRERNAGLDGLPEQHVRRHSGGEFAHNSGSTDSSKNGAHSRNHHPTVKPVALMRHLVRLVTPPGGTVLDPFAGSGTTLVAAVLEGMHAIGCEMTDEYLPIIEGRVAWAEQQADAQQPTLL